MPKVKVALNIGFTDEQSAIFDDPTRFKTIAKGRRFGFTHGVSNYLITEMKDSDVPLKCLWGDTVTGNIKRYINRYWMPALQQLPSSFYKIDKTNNIVYIGESYCDFRSADRPENWEGYGYDLVVLNEAGVILKNPYLWGNAVRPMLLDNPLSRAIIGGVPKGKNLFYDLCNQTSPNWKHWTVTSFDNPLLQESDINELIKELRRIGGNNFVKQEIFADFLDSSDLQYIEGDIVEKAMNRDHPMGTEYGAPKIAGIDFARKRDRCAISHRQGVKLQEIYVFHPEGEQWSVRFARHVVNRTINEWGADHIFVDEGESGGGVIDILQSWGYGSMITPVMFGSNPDNKDFYVNKRVEMYADLRAWLMEKGSLPKESIYANDLRRDLESLAYDHTDKGKLKLLPKAELSRSPDISDSVALTFAAPVRGRDDMGSFRDPYENSNTTYVR